MVWYDHQSPERDTPGPVRYHFEELITVDWRDKKGIEIFGPKSDHWRIHHPPALLLRMSRDFLLKERHKAREKLHQMIPSPRKVVYVSRADAGFIRVIQNEDLILKALKELLGEHCLDIFIANRSKMHSHMTAKVYGNPTKSDGKRRRLSILEQTRAFEEAELVIGPHGAGLTVKSFPFMSLIGRCVFFAMLTFRHRTYCSRNLG